MIGSLAKAYLAAITIATELFIVIAVVGFTTTVIALTLFIIMKFVVFIIV